MAPRKGFWGIFHVRSITSVMDFQNVGIQVLFDFVVLSVVCVCFWFLARQLHFHTPNITFFRSIKEALP
jgi:hypothetical protein